MNAAQFSSVKAAIGVLIVICAWLSGGHFAQSISNGSKTQGAFIHNGVWFTSQYAGSSNADPRTRALVAATGLLALPRQETIYFRAHKDNQGRPLSSQYDYIVSGAALPARWWSITLYDGDHFLNQQVRGPYSAKSTTIAPGSDGRYSIILSSKPHSGNWIDMGDGESMSLSLRVYNPEPSLVDNLDDTPLFSIERVNKDTKLPLSIKRIDGKDYPLGTEIFAQRGDKGRIAVYDRGPKDGETVVLLASLGRSVADFNALVEALNENNYRTIAVEMRGIGRSSPAIDAGLTLYDLGEDISAALDLAGLEKSQPINLIGHAFGNRLARAFASKNPQRVNKIVLLAAGGAQKLDDMPKAQQALIDSFNKELSVRDHKEAVRYAFFADHNPIPLSWLSGWHGAAAQMQARAVRNTPEVEWREGGGIAPILVVQPEDDRIAPAHLSSDFLKRQMPSRVSVVTIENAGHALLPEQPNLVTREVITFLSSDQ